MVGDLAHPTTPNGKTLAYRVTYKKAPQRISTQLRAAGYKETPFADITTFQSNKNGVLLVSITPDYNPNFQLARREDIEDYFLGYDVNVAFINVPQAKRGELEAILEEIKEL